MVLRTGLVMLRFSQEKGRCLFDTRSGFIEHTAHPDVSAEDHLYPPPAPQWFAMPQPGSSFLRCLQAEVVLVDVFKRLCKGSISTSSRPGITAGFRLHLSHSTTPRDTMSSLTAILMSHHPRLLSTSMLRLWKRRVSHR